MSIRNFALAAVISASASAAVPAAACDFETDQEIKMIAAAFEAWKAVADTMEECAPNMVAELDQEFRTKQPTAFAASPSLYHLGGVSNGTITPLTAEGTIRPLDEYVEKYGQHLNPNQLVQINGQTVALAMMVNMHHLQYRKDIFDDLGLEVPTTYDEMLEVAAAIDEAGVVEHPIGATMATGWDLAMDFVNLYAGMGGDMFDGSMATLNNETGVATLEKLKALTEYMDPEWTVSDSTYVQQQLQQGRIAMANFWHSRAAANDDPNESQVVGKVHSAASPLGQEGGRPSTMVWWDGIVVAKNIPDEEAEAAFQLALEGISPRTVEKANDVALWLIEGYEPTRMAEGGIATLQGGPLAYPSTAEMGLLHTAIGNTISEYLIGNKSAEEALADAEAAYETSAKEAGLL